MLNDCPCCGMKIDEMQHVAGCHFEKSETLEVLNMEPSALDDARLMRDYPLTTYTAKEARKIALGLLELLEGVMPTHGHCLLKVPQDEPGKPSPCAMAGFCLNAHGNDRRKGIASKSLWDRHERRKAS